MTRRESKEEDDDASENKYQPEKIELVGMLLEGLAFVRVKLQKEEEHSCGNASKRSGKMLSESLSE